MFGLGLVISRSSILLDIVRANLKMWLGFETSETLGREEVVNGDFALDSDWSEGDGWDIDTANNKITRTAQSSSTSAAQGISFVSGKSYSITYTLDVSAGSFLIRLGGDGVKDTPARSLDDTYTEVVTASGNYTTLNLRALDGTFAGSISNVSVRELTQITPDKSSNNNVGELFTGKALDFDGAGDYVDISGFSMSGNNATFAFWAYIRDNARADYFFDFHSTSTRFLFGFGQASQELAIYSNSGSGSWQDFGDPPQDQWVRIVLTVNGTTAKCFVDGVQLGTDKTISTYDFSTPTSANIGARHSPEPNPKWYDGLLSDFQIYNSVWAADDIAYDYANPQNLVTDRDNPTIALSNLKAYWAMSEGAGTVAYDSSGEGNNGTINSAIYELAQPRIPQLGMMNFSNGAVATGVTLIPDPNNTSQDIDGNAVRDRLNSFNLDGSGYAEVANSTSLSISNGTLQFWLKTTDTDFTILQGVVAKEYIGRTNNNAWSNGGTATISTFIDNAVSSSQPLYDNDWHFYTFTGINISLWSGFSIGDETFDGLISDVLIYDGVLTSNQIKNNYNAGLSAHTND